MQNPAEPTRDERLTTLLEAAESGDERAAADLLPLVYDDLRRLAAWRMAKLGPGQTLQPTALVHEAFLKVAGGQPEGGWQGRAHFFGAAARAMRDILVDQARRKARIKHGGGAKRFELEADELHDTAFETPWHDMIALDAAIRRLEDEHPQRAEIIMLRFFAGLTNEQIAEILSVSSRTVERGWRFARAFLRAELGENIG